MVNGLNNVRLSQRQKIIVTLKAAAVIGKTRASKILLLELVGLDHRPHGTVQHQDALLQQSDQFFLSILLSHKLHSFPVNSSRMER